MRLSLIGGNQLTKLLKKQHQLVSIQLLWTTDMNTKRQLYD